MSVKNSMATLMGPLHRMSPAGRRMRPGYLVIGTKRGGSTSLSDWIEEHPAVAQCRNRKGTHYFDTNYSRGPRWYASRFELASRGFTLTGEASPYYMYHPLGAQRIKDELPDVKILAVLRDPVERAWSQYQYEVARERETESFDTALDLETTRLEGEVDKLIADPRYEGSEFRHHGYLQRGHYADQLAKFSALFHQSQILVLKSEDMFAAPHDQLERVWEFLGLASVRLEHLGALNANTRRSSISEAHRQRLSDYYKPLNAALYSRPEITFRWEGP